jgi:hypothetical protein
MGLSSSVMKKSSAISGLQTGYLYHITLVMLIGTTMLLGVRQFWLVCGDFFDFRLFIVIFLSCFFLSTTNRK